MMQARNTTTGANTAGEILVRIAVYDEAREPTVTEVSASNPVSATNKISNLLMASASDAMPETAVREVVENLVHADYRGVVISVLEGGDVVRVADRGSGIVNKKQAMEFGFSGASENALKSIRGVGAGLGIASSEARKIGGTVTIEDNMGGGSVVTISTKTDGAVERQGGGSPVLEQPAAVKKHLDGVPKINISDRQSKTLITVLECGEVGPSTIADRLEVSVSTAYRDLSILEEHGLVLGDESGKRVISPLGKDYVEAIVSTWVK